MTGPVTTYAIFAESTITFGSPIAIWIISLIIGVAGLAVLILHYRDMKTKPRKRSEFLLWFFRLMVIAWITVVLLEPTIVRKSKLTEESDVIVLIDISDSMDLADRPEDPELQYTIAKLTGVIGEDQSSSGENKDAPKERLTSEQLSKVFNTSRKDIMKSFLLKDEGEFLDRLKDEFGLRLYSFASDIQPEEALSDNDALDGMFEGIARETGNSNLGDPLGDIERLVSKGNVSGIIVFTDGDWNAGPDPLMAVRKIAGANVPVFSVGLGNPDEVKDIEVTSVKAKKAVQVNDTVSVNVDLKSSGYDEETATVVLKEGDRVLQEKIVNLRKEFRTQTIRMSFKPTEERLMFCMVQVLPKADEAKDDNNHRTFEIDVTKGKKKVLYVEQLPRWEWRFIKNAVGRDPDFELTMVLFNAFDRPSEGEDYLPTLPMTKKELFGYDVIILGDVAREELSDAQLRLIEEFVAEQGSPLVIISGPLHMPYEYRGTAVETLMPIVLGDNPELRGGVAFEDGFSLELTTEGWNSPILHLADSTMENSRIWGELPKLFWCASVEKAKEGSIILATHPYLANRYGKLPLILTQRYGAGKVLMINIDSTWRWRYEKGDLYHYRFWGNILRWLAASPLDGKTRHVLLSIDKKEYYPGETANISVRVLDKNFYPYAVERVTLRVLKTPGKVGTTTLKLEDEKKGIYSGEYAFEESGTFEFSTLLPELGEEGNAKVRVDVTKVSVEDNSLSMNTELLKKIAAITGGSFHQITTAEAIPDEIIDRSRSREEVIRKDLWDNSYAIGIVVALLTLEWMLRKKLGYV